MFGWRESLARENAAVVKVTPVELGLVEGVCTNCPSSKDSPIKIGKS